jgi:hypothetical protein
MDVSMTVVMQEMMRCLDIRMVVFAFAKMHRPEERAKHDAATARLHELQAAYPASWRALKRRLGQR